jgi:uncharacterized membrane protein YcaP (DUF421 family)
MAGMNIWLDMLQPGIPILEKIIRPVIVYVFLIVALRLAGKRELAQINTFDLVVLLTLSNTVQNAIIGNDNSILGGIIGAATLLIINSIVVHMLYGHPLITRLIEGDVDVLIDKGQVNHDKLREEGITVHELEAAAHRQGFASLDTVETATLEASGAVCFIGKIPSEETVRHQELLQRIDQLSNELRQLRQASGESSA